MATLPWSTTYIEVITKKLKSIWKFNKRNENDFDMLILKHCGVERSEPTNLSEPHYRHARVCVFVYPLIHSHIRSSRVLMVVVVAEHSTDYCVADRLSVCVPTALSECACVHVCLQRDVRYTSVMDIQTTSRRKNGSQLWVCAALGQVLILWIKHDTKQCRNKLCASSVPTHEHTHTHIQELTRGLAQKHEARSTNSLSVHLDIFTYLN